MGYEKKFDIETTIKKARVFNKDKDRAEKLKHKEGYLKHLCSSFEDALFFSAVYSELFPEDMDTIRLLKNIVDNMFSSSGELAIFNIHGLEDIDELYRKFKIKARTAIKKLQMQEIAMIERIQKQTKEAEEQENQKKGENKIKTSIEPAIEHQKNQDERHISKNPKNYLNGLHHQNHSSIHHQNSHLPPEILINPFSHAAKPVPFGAIPRQSREMYERRRVGKNFADLSREMKNELLHDRKKREELKKKMPEMIKNIRREDKIRAAERLKQPVLQREEFKTFSK